MGFLDKLKSFMPKVTLAKEYHDAPSEQFKTQVDLMAYLIERMATEGWASFEAEANGHDVMIQVAGDCINACTEEIDVPAIARTIGLTSLASAVTPSGDDRTVHALPDASPQEIAEVVHGMFLHHYRLPPSYRVDGWLES